MNIAKIINEACKRGDLETIIHVANQRETPGTNEMHGCALICSTEEPFRLAANYGSIHMVYYLIICGANIHANYGYACRCASSKGYLQVVRCLVENGADIHLDLNLDAPITWAVCCGHLPVVQYLVSCGTDIRAQNSHILRIALLNNHEKIVRFLVSLDPEYYATFEPYVEWLNSRIQL